MRIGLEEAVERLRTMEAELRYELEQFQMKKKKKKKKGLCFLRAASAMDCFQAIAVRIQLDFELLAGDLIREICHCILSFAKWIHFELVLKLLV